MKKKDNDGPKEMIANKEEQRFKDVVRASSTNCET